MNLVYCGSAYGTISKRCNPRCVIIQKTDKIDNQAYLSYDCVTGVTTLRGEKYQNHKAAYGHTYLLSLCITTEEGQRCGEYFFLLPTNVSNLNTDRPDHQVLLLVDKFENNQNGEVVLFIPTSHVLLHGAQILSIQLLHDGGEEEVKEEDSMKDECWHHRNTSSVIFTHNITFIKYPGQNIRYRLTKNLPSGRYQLAMIPYKKDENGTFKAMAAPSCTCKLTRLNLGKHALAIILFIMGFIIVSGVFFTMYNKYKDDEPIAKDPAHLLVVADLNISEDHNVVMGKFFNYLKEFGGVDRVIYALDPDDGIDLPINMQTWWQKNLRDSKNIKDGFLVFVAGPTPPEIPPARQKFRNLVEMQMSELEGIEQGEITHPSLQQLTLTTLIHQKRMAIIKFPYSDFTSLPKQFPEKEKFSSVVIAVPLEMKELLRQIRRDEQLTVYINQQPGMNDTSIGRDLLKEINKICSALQPKAVKCVSSRKKSWAAVIAKSVSFLSQKDVILTVPLAYQETDEEDFDSEDSNARLVTSPSSV